MDAANTILIIRHLSNDIEIGYGKSPDGYKPHITIEHDNGALTSRSTEGVIFKVTPSIENLDNDKVNNLLEYFKNIGLISESLDVMLELDQYSTFFYLKIDPEFYMRRIRRDNNLNKLLDD